MAKSNAAQKNKQKMQKLMAKIAAQVRRGAGKGLKAAGFFLQARVKEALNVRAPRRLVHGRDGSYYVATTRATKGAPMRKVSGAAQKSVTTVAVSDREVHVGMNARSKDGFNYPRFHEVKSGGPRSGRHPSLEPTALKYRKELAEIAGSEVYLSLK